MEKFNPHDAIALLSFQREEKLSAETFVRFTQLMCWLISPLDEKFVNYFGHFAAARAMSLLEHKVQVQQLNPTLDNVERVRNEYFSANTIALGMLRNNGENCSRDDVNALINEADLARQFAQFQVQLHQNSQLKIIPSRNKAIRFMEENGYQAYDEPSASGTIDSSWHKYANGSPFLAAMEPIEDFALVAPHHPDFFLFFSEIYERKGLSEWFGKARYVQETLAEVLKATGQQQRLQFVFPDFVEAIPFEFGPFEPNGVKIIKSYTTSQKRK